MQTILSEEQMKLLDSYGIYYTQFINDKPSTRPKIKRQLKHYGMTSKVTWAANGSILTLAWLGLKQSQHNKLADIITPILNCDYYKTNENIFNLELKSNKDISSFYNQLSKLEDFQFLAWFFCHTDSILEIYKYNASKFIDFTFHQFEIDTPDFKLKGSQKLALNWLLERIQIIINSNYRPEEVKKFFLVWAEVHYMFWW